MTDENVDVENVEMTEVQANGGYIDDVIDVDDDDDDDDDDDEPLVPSNRGGVSLPSTHPLTGPTPSSRPKKRARGPISTTPAGIKAGGQRVQNSRKPSDPLPTDYLLRAAGVRNARQFVIAHFRTGMPRLAGADDSSEMHLRLTRDGERTVNGRVEALETDKKEQAFLNSYSGKRREARRSKQGFVTIRKRLQKEWSLEVAPKEIAERLVADRQARVEQKLKRSEDANGKAEDDGNEADKEKGSDDVDEDDDENQISSELKESVTTYTGHFDGRANSRYAIMIMNGKDRTIDVVPVDDYASFSFREDQVEKVKTAEEVDALAKKLRTSREKSARMTNFSDKYMDAQMRRDLSLGDNSRLMEHPEFFNAGIKRGNTRGKNDGVGGEEFDFEKEFDNDDDLTVDKELMPKKEKEILREAAESRRLFERMIRDEQASPTDKGERSEEDEEGGQSQSQGEGEGEGEGEGKSEASGDDSGRTGDKSGPAGQMQAVKVGDQKGLMQKTRPGPSTPTKAEPLVIGKGNLARPVSTGSATAGGSSRTGGSGRGSGNGSAGGRASPSSTVTGRSGTPQRIDVSHLLPPAGAPLRAEHVRAVLTALLKDRTSIPLKEVSRCFKYKSKEQKSNLVRIIKEVAVVTALRNKPESIMISLRE